ncbi:MAG: hypothetical protein WCF04_00605 [Candidatus Nanopelagicales bacterium]
MFARPRGGGVTLELSPVLESWNAKDHPDQVRLAAYLDEMVKSVALEGTADHLALELIVGLPTSKSLAAGGGDLDNYLFPVARRLGAKRFDAVFGAKRHSDASTVAVSPAVEARPTRPPDMTVRTTESASSRAWKERVRAACASAAPSSPISGPISIDIEFRLSSARNWATLWKPAIDSLGPLLGTPDSKKPFAPADDRIVALGLHRHLDEALGWDIALQVWWAGATRA